MGRKVRVSLSKHFHVLDPQTGFDYDPLLDSSFSKVSPSEKMM